jgi:hypothetical protein
VTEFVRLAYCRAKVVAFQCIPNWRSQRSGGRIVREKIGGFWKSRASSATGLWARGCMQSLSRQVQTSELVKHYGRVIADECHHTALPTFMDKKAAMWGAIKRRG